MKFLKLYFYSFPNKNRKFYHEVVISSITILVKQFQTCEWERKFKQFI